MGVELWAGEEDAGARLDVFLARHLDGLSRARARRLIEEAAVRVDGRRARKGLLLRRGDRVVLDAPPPPADFVPVAVDGPLRVVHEDRAMVVVDKPAGVPTHPLRPEERDTLANALLARYPELAGIGYAGREPGLVHRLDNETSGLLIAARDRKTFEALRAALRAGAIDKRYALLVDGRLEAPRTIDRPLGRRPRDRRRVAAVGEGREARTEVLCSEAIGDAFSLLEAKAPRALRHQLRAHLAAIGHPLVGDALYGGSSRDALGRHFLHASTLRLAHPATGRPLELHAELPPELARFLRANS